MVMTLADANDRFNNLSQYSMLWEVWQHWPSGSCFAHNMFQHECCLLLFGHVWTNQQSSSAVKELCMAAFGVWSCTGSDSSCWANTPAMKTQLSSNPGRWMASNCSNSFARRGQALVTSLHLPRAGSFSSTQQSQEPSTPSLKSTYPSTSVMDRNTLACSLALLQNKSIGSASHCQLGIWHCMPCDCLLISPFGILRTYMLPLCWMAVPIPSGPWYWAKLGPIELALHDKFIPAILGTDTPPDDDLWCLLSLRVKQGARRPCILWSHNTSHSPHPVLMSGHRDISLLCLAEHSPQHMKSPSMNPHCWCHRPQSLSEKRKGSTNLIAQSNLKIQKHLEHPPSLTES